MRKFLRRNSDKYKRLGLGSKKKQKWRRPRGIHSKIRKRRKGYPARVDIGYRTPRDKRGKISGMLPIMVKNIQDLQKVGPKEIAILAHFGKRKRVVILKKAKEMKIQVLGEK